MKWLILTFIKSSLNTKIKTMKKIYTLIALATLAFGANAQNRGSVNPAAAHKANVTLNKQVMPVSGSRIAGDTLMRMQLPGYSINPTDAATFDIITEDIDGFATYNVGYAMDFGLYYSTDSSTTAGDPTQDNFYHPWEVPAPVGTDSAFFWSATSWFASPAQADNWLMFGPLTVPAGGASLVWFDRTNRYRDGYLVKVADATTASTPLSFVDFDVSTTIFTETDDAYPSATWAVDTTWEMQNVMLPASFNGMTVVIAFHHNANDQDVLRLDEIMFIDGSLAMGIQENVSVNGITVAQNMPNPFSSLSTISYQLEKNAPVVLSVYDVTGKLISEQYAGEQSAGNHTIDINAENISAGVYYYSIKAGENTSAAVKMVVIK
jgi:hypothetical protein